MGREYALKTKTIFIGDIAADSDALLLALWKLDHAIKISAIRIGVKATVTKADTNYNTFQVKDGSNVVAAVANGPNSAAGTTFTLGTFADMVVAAAYAEAAALDTLSFKITKTGTGLAMTGVCIQIEYYDYNA